VAFGLALQSLIPYSYTLLTIINFLLFARFKNFQLERMREKAKTGAD